MSIEDKKKNLALNRLQQAEESLDIKEHTQSPTLISR